MNEHISSEELSFFLDGELPPERLKAIRAHLEACPECRLMFETDRWIDDMVMELPWNELRTSEPLALPPEEHDRYARLRGWQALREWLTWPRAAVVVPVSLVLLLVLLATLLCGSPLRPGLCTHPAVRALDLRRDGQAVVRGGPTQVVASATPGPPIRGTSVDRIGVVATQVAHAAETVAAATEAAATPAVPPAPTPSAAVLTPTPTSTADAVIVQRPPEPTEIQGRGGGWGPAEQTEEAIFFLTMTPYVATRAVEKATEEARWATLRAEHHATYTAQAATSCAQGTKNAEVFATWTAVALLTRTATPSPTGTRPTPTPTPTLDFRLTETAIWPPPSPVPTWTPGPATPTVPRPSPSPVPTWTPSPTATVTRVDELFDEPSWPFTPLS